MNHSFDLALAELSRSWRQQGITVGPPVLETSLRRFETKFGVTCPDDFAKYLLTVGGMPDHGDADTQLIRFWPLNEIKPLQPVQHLSLEGVFIFADYSLSAHEYGIRLSGPHVGEVSIVHDPGFKTIAATFTEFVNLYLENPMSLFQK